MKQKAKLIKARLSGKISQKEFINYLKLIIPDVFFMDNNKHKSDKDKIICEICKQIDFELLIINIVEV